jgi:hypothetical protein
MAVLVAGATHAGNDRGASASATLQVTVTVVSSCAITSSAAGHVEYRCGSTTVRPARIDNAPNAGPKRQAPPRTTTGPQLTTIDF